jgi:uncharacterized protein (TIGR00255 family)
MPVYSMTGYASASAGGATNPESGAVGGSVSVELRSVNGRFLDLSLRLPDELRALEPALRELVSATFKRGKIELRVSTGREGEGLWPRPTPEQLSLLSRLESTVQGWMSKAQPLSVHEVLQWCRSGGTSVQPDEIAMEAARAAVEGLREAREREGTRLVAILMERVRRLRELAAQAEPLVPLVVQRQQQRFLERWREALATAGAGAAVSAEAQAERALAEAAAYAIRIDVAEELSRLKAHLEDIERLLAKGGELGKRLDFLIQELHREANTLGSKSATLELTTIAVDMKVLIEQLREQVQNIE